MKFSNLVEYFSQIDQTSSRLTMTDILVELLKKASASEIEQVVNLSLGQLRPKYLRLEFNLADKMVVRAIAQSEGMEPAEVLQLYKEMGDLGEVAQQTKKQKTETKELSIVELYQQLVEIAQYSGAGSQEMKLTGLAQLLQHLEPTSVKYVVRIILGRLRLGFSDMTVLDALSVMAVGDKSKRKELEGAFQVSPDVAYLAKLVKESGVEGIEDKVQVRLGVPIIPALAQRLKTADEMIKKMGQVAVEPKFDGTRVQIHFKRRKKGATSEWEVRTFTRNLDETSFMFPELQKLSDFVDADELILDSEGIGYDPKTGKLLPFQETIQRKRKHGIQEAAASIPLKFFIFDIMYKDGQSLVNLPFHQRRQLLEKTITQGELLELPEVLVTTEPQELRQFHAHQLAEGLEGALVKKYDGVYEPGRRGWSWVKFKEVETSKAKLSDTVDAVVMGLYVGKGKRTSFGVGAFLIGVRDEATNTFKTISKVGTGLSDEQWVELKERSKALVVSEQPLEYEVRKDLATDFWLNPELVVEVAADEITKSPIHTAELALRFPRLVRFRDDKSAQQATTLEELKQIS